MPSAHFAARRLALHRSLTGSEATSKPRIFGELARLIRLLPYFPELIVHGSFTLDALLNHQLIRPIDECAILLRDPIDIMIERVNQFLTRLKGEAARSAFSRDVQAALDSLDLHISPGNLTRPFLDHLAVELLREPSIIHPNPMCRWLGGGSTTEVLERLGLHDVEVTTDRHYEAWLKSRWDVQATINQVPSGQFLDSSRLSSSDRAYICDVSADDMTLYETLTAAIDEERAVSIRCGSVRVPHS